ncbi:TIGR02466 family protein [Paracraurococcus ruber]|nr:TIGR02466 family protein [Paracraurococcus ruber]TDG14492.1 hypothetical protein E2C05_29935 [Paracraurococcus ruber]
MAMPALLSLEPLFASPLLRFGVPDAEGLNAMLLAEVSAMRAASPGIARSNRQGWHSATDLFERTEPGCALLRRHVLDAARQAALALAPDLDLAAIAVQGEAWVNVNGPGAFNVPHEHPGWTFSGCYYVAMPETAEARGGAIEFLDTRMGVAAFGLAGSDTFSGKVACRPAPGEMLIFPCWLKHWVYPHDAAAERVTIAFNLRCVPRRRQGGSGGGATAEVRAADRPS